MMKTKILKTKTRVQLIKKQN